MTELRSVKIWWFIELELVTFGRFHTCYLREKVNGTYEPQSLRNYLLCSKRKTTHVHSERVVYADLVLKNIKKLLALAYFSKQNCCNVCEFVRWVTQFMNNMMQYDCVTYTALLSLTCTDMIRCVRSDFHLC